MPQNGNFVGRTTYLQNVKFICNKGYYMVGKNSAVYLYNRHVGASARQNADVNTCMATLE